VTYRFYPNSSSPDGSFSADEIRRGFLWLSADVECPHCGHVQSVASTGYQGGPCVWCGKLTSGEEEKSQWPAGTAGG
jgi:ribosomal protein S27E